MPEDAAPHIRRRSAHNSHCAPHLLCTCSALALHLLRTCSALAPHLLRTCSALVPHLLVPHLLVPHLCLCRTCAALVPHLCRTCAALMPLLCRTCAALVPHLCRTCAALVPHLCRTCAALVPHLCRTCSARVPQCGRICGAASSATSYGGQIESKALALFSHRTLNCACLDQRPPVSGQVYSVPSAPSVDTHQHQLDGPSRPWGRLHQRGGLGFVYDANWEHYNALVPSA